MTTRDMDFTSLSVRLESLERQNRRMKRGGAVLALVCAAAMLVAARKAPAAPTKSVTAQKFVLADRTRKTLAVLGPDTAGRPSLTLYGTDGAARATIGLDALEWPSVVLSNASRSTVASLQLNGGKPALSLDGAAQGNVALGVRADGSVGMSATGPDGSGLIDLSLANAGLVGRLYVSNVSAVGMDGKPTGPVGGVELGTSGFDHAYLQITPPRANRKAELRLGSAVDGFTGIQILDDAGLKTHQVGSATGTVGLVNLSYENDIQYVVDDPDTGAGHLELGAMQWLPYGDDAADAAAHYDLIHATEYLSRSPTPVR